MEIRKNLIVIVGIIVTSLVIFSVFSVKEKLNVDNDTIINNDNFSNKDQIENTEENDFNEENLDSPEKNNDMESTIITPPPKQKNTVKENSSSKTASNNSNKTASKSSNKTQSSQKPGAGNTTEEKKELNRSSKKNIWDELGISEYDYYHSPAGKDYKVTHPSKSACQTEGNDKTNDKVIFDENGDEQIIKAIYNRFWCMEVVSYSGDIIGYMLELS